MKIHRLPVRSLIQTCQFRARLGQLAAHPQALEEIDCLGEGHAGGGEVDAQMSLTM